MGPATLRLRYRWPLIGSEFSTSGYSRLSLRHVNVLYLGVTFHGGHTEIAAEATLFAAPDRRLDMNAAVAVHAQHATFHPSGYAQGPAQVVGPKRPAQTEGRGIHVTDHLRFI